MYIHIHIYIYTYMYIYIYICKSYTCMYVYTSNITCITRGRRLLLGRRAAAVPRLRRPAEARRDVNHIITY